VKRIVFGTIGLALYLISQGRPDFSGSWAIDPTRSHFGPIGPPSAFERTIKQSPNEMHSFTRQSGQHGDSHTNVRYSLDGKENVISLHGDEARVTGKWMMSNLIVETRRKNAEGDIVSTETWSLEEGGKALLIQAKVTRGKSVFPMTIYLLRQAPPKVANRD
jgi:hypothetical protein